jgi:hypothetical protein
MPTSQKQKTVLVVIIGAIATITPAFLSYCTNNAEIKMKYKAAGAASEAGYQALVKSVEELQKAVLSQHDKIVMLQGQIELMGMMRARARVGSPRITESPDTDGDGIADFTPEEPAPISFNEPSLTPPPVNLKAAQQITR